MIKKNEIKAVDGVTGVEEAWRCRCVVVVDISDTQAIERRSAGQLVTRDLRPSTSTRADRGTAVQQQHVPSVTDLSRMHSRWFCRWRRLSRRYHLWEIDWNAFIWCIVLVTWYSQVFELSLGQVTKNLFKFVQILIF